MRVIAYVAFIVSRLLDLVTTLLCLRVDGLVETGPIYQVVGAWAFPTALLVDALILLSVELILLSVELLRKRFPAVEILRKHMRWYPLVLLIPILIYTKACVTNLQILRWM